MTDDQPSASTAWFVARTHPRREKWAVENCQRQGAETYFPQILEETFRRARKVLRLVPLFPGYMFVRTGGNQWHFLIGTFGMIGLIMRGASPDSVSDAIVDDIRSREKEGRVVLPPAEKRRLFAVNSPVRVGVGPLEGRIGLIDGYSADDRVKVLLSLLGRKISVLFDEESLETA